VSVGSFCVVVYTFFGRAAVGLVPCGTVMSGDNARSCFCKFKKNNLGKNVTQATNQPVF